MENSLIPLIDAGYFSGCSTEDPQDFIEKYNLAAKSNNWTAGTKLRLLPAHLTDVALLWYC
jgi:hypothetical protein